ncbi:MAG: DEAD/DEAH box helicase [Verrucomicrobiota bacterium]
MIDSGYTTPTEIQTKCIPPLLDGRDVLGSAQTGTGKTAAFTLPLIQFIMDQERELTAKTPRVLIMAPTRELAAQIGKSIETYSKYVRVSHAVIFGGVGQNPQERAMKRGVDFLVATPGRLLDLVNQGAHRAWWGGGLCPG